MPYQLHYFTLRLWLEVIEGEQVEWRGELRNTSTGEIRYFRQGPMLLDLLTVMMAAPIGGVSNPDGTIEDEKPAKSPSTP
jgi:hypothetical protein